MRWLHNLNNMQEHHITFFTGYHKVIGTVTVAARGYTIHEILVEMALQLLPSSVECEYNRYSVLLGALLEGGEII